jgi:cytoskeletal protein CcmA (bactofilin family)
MESGRILPYSRDDRSRSLKQAACLKLTRDGLLPSRPPMGLRGSKEIAMKRAIRGVALTALALAAITGCGMHVDGDDSVTHEFGSDYFGAGGRVNLTRPVEGDAFLAGGRVSVASEVKGDLIAAGGEVSVGGAVSDDLYAAGGSVQVDALVDGNARIAGGEIAIGPATVIDGALSLTGGRIQFDGSTHRYLQASGGTVRLNGEVRGDAEIRAEDLVIEPGTRIAGKLTYRGPEEPRIPDGAVIAGGVEFHERTARHFIEDTDTNVHVSEHGVGSVVWMLGVFIAAAIFLLLFPRYSREAAAAIGRAPLRSIGLGLAIFVCVPFVGVVLLITIIGIPLALLLIPFYLLVLFLGWVTAALFVAQRGLEALRPRQPVTTAWWLFALFMGLLALWLVGKIPLVGDLMAFIALIAGIGALTWKLWNDRAGSPTIA